MLCGGPVTLTYRYYRNRLSYQSRSIYILYALFMVSGAANVYKIKGENTKTLSEVWTNVRYYSSKFFKNIKFTFLGTNATHHLKMPQLLLLHLKKKKIACYLFTISYPKILSIAHIIFIMQLL